jgi:putative protein-disulfide isomerase
MTAGSPDIELIYVGDPMCSWCWGFVPTLRALEAHFDIPLRVVVGGLRAGPSARRVDERVRGYLAHHWEEVGELSGQPFDAAMLDREGFLYDTEPACTAVVAMRRLAPQHTLDWFERLQRAFYAEVTDITDPHSWSPLLADLHTGITGDLLLAEASESDARRETWQDFATAQEWGVTGFPTLLVRDGAALGVASRGWAAPDDLVGRLDEWLRDQHGEAAEGLVCPVPGRRY